MGLSTVAVVAPHVSPASQMCSGRRDDEAAQLLANTQTAKRDETSAGTRMPERSRTLVSVVQLFG